jgi:hypothetical protein
MRYRYDRNKELGEGSQVHPLSICCLFRFRRYELRAVVPPVEHWPQFRGFRVERETRATVLIRVQLPPRIDSPRFQHRDRRREQDARRERF